MREVEESMIQIWTRYYDSQPEDNRLALLGRLKGLMWAQDGEISKQAETAFRTLAYRWAVEKPVK